MRLIDKLLKSIFSLFSKILQVTGRGNGTALPGFIIEKFYPSFIKYLARDFDEVIFVTGTNGKTTIVSMLSKVYKELSYEVASNIEGSNMIRGVISTLVSAKTPRTKNSALILEVEEGTIAKLANYIKPDYIILTNIFRDQLDVYGEIEQVKQVIIAGIRNSPDAIVIYNFNDPILRDLINVVPNVKLPYGLTDELLSNFRYEASDKPQSISTSTLAPKVKFLNSIDHIFSQTIVVNIGGQAIQYDLGLTGIYNVLNSLAVFTLCLAKGFEMDEVVPAIEKVVPTFGRGERIFIEGKSHKKNLEIRLFLAKNPAGFEQILDVLAKEPKLFNLPNIKHIFILNDNLADGRDVSWIWDVNFEKSQIKLPVCICSGERAEDMALRLKYSNVSSGYTITPEIDDLVDDMMESPCHYRVVANYTGMMNFRKSLQRYTNLKDFS